MRHRAVIEAGPAAIRRLCCGAVESDGSAAALEWMDDPVALVDGQPIELPELLRNVMTCPEPAESIEIVHPSWWPARRVRLFVTAANDMADHVTTRRRSELYSDAVVVEIADSLVAVTAVGTVAEPRIGAPGDVAEAVARRVRDHGAVVIDAPVSVGGAAALAVMIAERLPGDCRIVEELPLRAPTTPEQPEPLEPARTGRRSWMPPVAAAAALGVVAVALRMHHDTPPATTGLTYLVEGRVAVQVPTGWPVRRVTAGPGTARVEVSSPADPALVLHLTQAPAAGDTLAAVAEPLQRALELADAETPGVFVDFDPAGSRAGRPAVTYREVREAHRVDWTVLVDGAVRIGIGCQSGLGGDGVLRAVCEQAVRSAHAVG